MKMEIICKVVVLFLLSLLISCSSMNNFSVSSSKATRAPSSLAEIKVDSHAWQYHRNISLERLQDLMINMDYIHKEDRNLIYFARDNNWDQAVKQLFEEAVNVVENNLEVDHIPRPDLVFFKSAMPNAFVAPAKSCLGIPVQTEGEERKVLSERPIKLSSDNREITIRAGGDVFSREFKGCPDELSKQEQIQFMDSLSGKEIMKGGHSCFYSEASSSRKLVLSCDGVNFGFKNTMILRTLPFVFVNTGLISIMKSWEQLLAIFFHELGHYYLPHLNVLEAKRYGYFYSLSKQVSPWQPNEEGAFSGLGQLLNTLGKIKTSRTIPEFYNSYSSLADILEIMPRTELLYEPGGFQLSSKQCGEIFLSPQKVKSLGGLMEAHSYRKEKVGQFDELFSKQVSSFLRSKSGKNLLKRKLVSNLQKLKDCMKTIKVEENPVLSEEESERFQEFKTKSSIDSLKYVYLLLNHVSLMDVFLILHKNLELPGFTNSWDAYVYIDRFLSDEIASLSSNPQFLDLGRYNFEEEADVFAVEMSIVAGTQPLHLKESLFSMMEKVTKHPGYVASAADVSYEKCKTAIENNWKIDGKDFKPLLTDISSAHHNLCYRLYNLTRFSLFENLSTPGKYKIEMPTLGYNFVKKKNTGWLRWLKITW